MIIEPPKPSPGYIPESWEDDLPNACKKLTHLDHLPKNLQPETRMEKLTPEQMGDLVQKSKDLSYETPIYYDPENMFYYYPCIALETPSRAPRKIIYTYPPLDYNPTLDLFIDPNTGWKYVQVRSVLEFDQLRFETPKRPFEEINRSRAEDTPIFINDKGETFYPKVALYEKRLRVRSELIGDLVEIDGEFESQTGERYLKINGDELKELRMKRLEEVKKKLVPTAGVFYDQGVFWFPVSAATQFTPRYLIRKSEPVSYSEVDEGYYDIETGEAYIPVRCPLDFEAIQVDLIGGAKPPKLPPPAPIPPPRKMKLQRRLERLEPRFRVENPEAKIYQDPFTDQIFYPLTAFLEIELVEHPVLKQKPPLTYYPDNYSLLDPTGEEYLGVTQEEFEELRGHIQEIVLSKPSQATEDSKIIYWDSTGYYFPTIALYDLEPQERTVLGNMPEMSLDSRVSRYLDEKGRTYFVVTTPAEFEELKNQRVKNRKKKAKPTDPKDTPVYRDPISRKLYYPYVAVEELEEKDRDLVVMEPPLDYDPKILAYIKRDVMEEYVEVMSEREFKELR